MTQKHRAATKRLSAKTCKELTELIENYLTDQLPLRLKREFERHLSICPDCVSFLKTYKKTTTLSRAIEPSALPAKVRDNVLEFLRKKMRRIAALFFCLAGQFFA